MKANVIKTKPRFELQLTAEEVVHLEAALDFAVSAANVNEQERLSACFGIYDEEQSDDLMYKLWRGFSKMREDVMLAGGLDDD